MPYLILRAGENGYKIYHFTSDVSIGRHPNSDIVLASDRHNTISRYHAHIQHDQQGFSLQDSSLNGTLVNDELIQTHRLSDGDQFQVANYTFTFIEDTEVEPIKKSQMVLSSEPDLKETEEIVRCDRVMGDLSDPELMSRLKTYGIIVADQRMLALFHDVHSISHINVPVLILGEPGTGKEKVAQALHGFSQSKGEFVAVNCSAIPENLFESELFGSVKGAFSDAATKPGKLELADKGTLFLDEIGDMSLASQPKLLRFLESRMVSRLGDTRDRQLNLRIVAATNQDLTHMIQSQTFRADLFQRLACVKLKIPPLRERKQDILPLAKKFIGDFTSQYDLTPLKITKQAADLMLSYDWPGNVRELANIMLNICVRIRGDSIMPVHLISASEEMGASESKLQNRFPSLNDMERIHIQKALDETDNNKSKASKLLGISRDTLYKKLQKYKIV
jgi:transcriptional regulator with PAS, ATPase and Fis domain